MADAAIHNRFPRSTAAKRCTKCGVVKQAKDFSSNWRSSDGLYPWCKPCRASYDAARSSAVTPATARRGRPRKLSAAEIVEVQTLHSSEGASLRTLAARFGVSHTTIANALKTGGAAKAAQ